MSDIFREVDEALQKEKLAQFWRGYGPVVVLAAIALILGTAASTGYRTWKSHADKEATSKLVVAAEQKDIAASMEKASEDVKGAHKTVAQLNAAARYAQDKNFDKAAALYDTVSKDGDTPASLKDLSAILYARAALLTQSSSPDYKALADRLAPIASNNDSPFNRQARLDLALLYGGGMNDYTKALELLKGFDVESVSDSLTEKATALTHVYEYELSNAKTAAPAAQTTQKTE